jgi:GT2 family glycosyltransferase
MTEFAVVIVSFNSREWLASCISSIYTHAGGADVDVVVVDNDSSDGSAELVEELFPQVRVLRCENGGFAHGNNRGLLTVDAPFVLLLNPDAEIVQGEFHQLLEWMTDRPEVGLVGCRQIGFDGSLYPTIRRFPSLPRLLLDAMGAERMPLNASWRGERQLDPRYYEREVSCDWVTGSFMLIRREAFLTAGIMDERFFLYGEEVDLCHRIKRAGWEILHVPTMTIRHPWDREGFDARLEAQQAFARRQYMEKYFSRSRLALGLFALGLGYAVRSVVARGNSETSRERRRSSREALRTLLGLAPPPFCAPPGQAMPAGVRDVLPAANQLGG